LFRLAHDDQEDETEYIQNLYKKKKTEIVIPEILPTTSSPVDAAPSAPPIGSSQA
jgi:hypothetical protein